MGVRVQVYDYFVRSLRLFSHSVDEWTPLANNHDVNTDSLSKESQSTFKYQDIPLCPNENKITGVKNVSNNNNSGFFLNLFLTLAVLLLHQLVIF